MLAMNNKYGISLFNTCRDTAGDITFFVMAYQRNEVIVAQ